MEHQDWKPIIFGKNKNTPAYKQQDKVIVAKVNYKGGVDASKLERDEEEGKKLKIYGTEYGKKVQNARLEKKWTQKQLGQKLNVKVDIIQKIENGKGLLDGQICNNIFRILGIKRN